MVSFGWSHCSPCFDTATGHVSGPSNLAISLLCPPSAVKESSARSSIGEPDGRLRIGTTLGGPHSETSDVRAFHAGGADVGIVKEWGCERLGHEKRATGLRQWV
jgi:hypothetical protein